VERSFTSAAAATVFCCAQIDRLVCGC
jgi:hypothetical protein